MKTPSPQHGASLLEALISLLVLSAGVVGAVRMQTAILDSHCNAKAVSETTSLVQSIVESIAVKNASSCCDPNSTAPAAQCPLPTAPAGTTYSVALTASAADSCLYDIRLTQAQGICKTAAFYNERKYLLNIPPHNSYTGPASGSGAPGLSIPNPTVARRVNENPVATLPGTAEGTSADAAIKVFIRRDGDGPYRLFTQLSNGLYKEQIQSTNRLVRISGIVGLHSTLNKPLQLESDLINTNKLRIITSGVGYCQFPLRYGKANDPTTYEAAALPTNTRSAAYVCYVPEGWYGNVGLDFENVPSKVIQCPDNPDEPGMIGGLRSHKVIFSAPPLPPTSLDKIQGQSGLLVRHEEEGLLRGLHFVMVETNDNKATCNSSLQPGISFSSHSTPATSITLNRVGLGGLKQLAEDRACSTTQAATCVRTYDYWVEVVGLRAVSGVLQREAGSEFRWDAIKLFASRTAPFGGTLATPCALDDVPDAEQTTAPQVTFDCPAGDGVSVTLTIDSVGGERITAPADTTFTAPAFGVVLTVGR
ncbi:type IV pilus modification PilV family protein [Tepidimonas sediminis]|nr:hypothetical protein [Tepidimonas sediminis]